MKRKICVVTGSRAEYGHLYWLMKEIEGDSALELEVIATGAHLAPAFGLTFQAIERDGFRIDRKIELPLSDDSAVAITKALGVAVSQFADAFQSLKPDIVVLLGDRYEILAAAQAALLAQIPIAHLHGGESTIGAIDEAIRHAITKMSSFHFTAAEPYRERVIQMGEAPERVFSFGAPGLDHLSKLKLLEKDELERELKFTFGKITFLITFHPVTLERQGPVAAVRELLTALNQFPIAKIILTHPNADPGFFAIRDLFRSYAGANQDRAVFFTSLGQVRYLSVLKYVDLVIGNSSSGLIEAPSFKKPAVDIGDRQKGRLAAESVIHCRSSREDMVRAIETALSPEFQARLSYVKNPYEGEEEVSVRIKEVLKHCILDETTLKKEFYSLGVASL